MMRVKTQNAEFDGKTEAELRRMLQALRDHRDTQPMPAAKSTQARMDRIQRIIDKLARRPT